MLKIYPTIADLENFFNGLIGRIISTISGYVSMCFVLIFMLIGGDFSHPTFKETEDLDKAREKWWSLKHRPGGLKHRFLDLPDGFRMHYLMSEPDEPESGSETSESAGSEKRKHPDVVVFLHGWPDSSPMWAYQMTHEKLKKKAIMIAVDIPGNGGSDGLYKYTADLVLTKLAQFLIEIRKKYAHVEFDEDGKVSQNKPRFVVASHDWGSMLAYRLAARAPQLADRFIICNVYYPQLMHTNVTRCVNESWKYLWRILEQPLKFHRVHEGLVNLCPVVEQFRKSWYVSVFQLPESVVTRLLSVGHFSFLRCVIGWSRTPEPPVLPERYSTPGIADKLAIIGGPGIDECVEVGDGHDSREGGYSSQVRLRAPLMGLPGKVGLYRDNLIFQEWTIPASVEAELNDIGKQSIGQLLNGGAPAFSTSGYPPGSFAVPMTVIWGKQDIALNEYLSINGLEEYFAAKNSQVMTIEGTGHWVPTSEVGRDLYVDVVEWALIKTGSTLEEWMDGKASVNVETSV